MVRGSDVRVVRGTAVRFHLYLGGISAVLCALPACSPETATELRPSGEPSSDVPSRVSQRAKSAVHRLSSLLEEPLAPAQRTGRLHLDATRPADRGTSLREPTSSVTVVVRLEGAAPVAPEPSNGLFVYPSVLPSDADALIVPRSNGFEDWVLLPASPGNAENHGVSIASVAYDVDLDNVAGLRLVSGVLELLDATGTPRLRARRPWLIDATKTRFPAHFELPDCHVDTSPAPPWRRPVRAPGRSTCRVLVAWDDARVTYPAALDPVWESTDGSLSAARRWATATPLGDDLLAPVLFAGGFDGTAALSSAELYEPGSRTFAATGDLKDARGASAAARLPDGRVLLMGGAASSTAGNGAPGGVLGGILGSIERYDPATGAFTKLGASLNPARAGLSATTLGDGKVLMAGGQDSLAQPLKKTALFDPSTSSLASGPDMFAAHVGHAAAAIDGAHVLVTGGVASLNGNATTAVDLFTQDIQSPMGGTFSVADALNVPRAFHSATPIGNGRILLSGGIANPNDPQASLHGTADMFTPTAEGAGPGVVTTLASKMSIGRAYHSAVRLPQGVVVLSGGFGAQLVAGAPHAVSSATDLFDPATSLFTKGPAMSAPRMLHTLTPVNPVKTAVNGVTPAAESALAAGGASVPGGGTAALSSAELLFRPLGEKCAAGPECATGYCSDGVCCDAACDGECDSCVDANKQLANDDGYCGPTLLGVSDNSPELTSGVNLGTTCVNSEVAYHTCDGLGNRKTYWAEPCNGNTCDPKGVKCQEGCDNDLRKCIKSYYCDIPANAAEGDCKPQSAHGQACTADEQCLSEHCVDGVCCDGPCDGVCVACNLPDLPGKCMPVGAPDNPMPPFGMRKCQKDSDPVDLECGGKCVGLAAAEDCSYPGDEASCGDKLTCACEGGDCETGAATQTRFACDSAGACGPTTKTADGSPFASDCAGYVCVAAVGEGISQCGSTCVHDAKSGEDTGCLQNHYCDGAACLPRPETGVCDGVQSLLLPSGESHNCHPYKCTGRNTQCDTECDSDDDCVLADGGDPANDLVCSSRESPGKGRCLPRLDDVPERTACAFSPAGAPERDPAWWIGLSLALFAVRARRRR